MLIDRRAFAASLGLLGIGWRAAHGRPNMPRIGILLVENREPFASEFRAGLQGHVLRVAGDFFVLLQCL